MEVKIILEENESEIEATELLIKAMQSHATGEHHKEDFHQPAARDVVNKLINAHTRMTEEMMREIFKVLEEEVK